MRIKQFLNFSKQDFFFWTNRNSKSLVFYPISDNHFDFFKKKVPIYIAFKWEAVCLSIGFIIQYPLMIGDIGIEQSHLRNIKVGVLYLLFLHVIAHLFIDQNTRIKPSRKKIRTVKG